MSSQAPMGKLRLIAYKPGKATKTLHLPISSAHHLRTQLSCIEYSQMGDVRRSQLITKDTERHSKRIVSLFRLLLRKSFSRCVKVKNSALHEECEWHKNQSRLKNIANVRDG